MWHIIQFCAYIVLVEDNKIMIFLIWAIEILLLDKIVIISSDGQDAENII
jgi:hypothetical protein